MSSSGGTTGGQQQATVAMGGAHGAPVASSTGAPLPGAKRAATLGDERERVGARGKEGPARDLGSRGRRGTDREARALSWSSMRVVAALRKTDGRNERKGIGQGTRGR